MRAGEPAALRAILERAAVETRALRHGYIGSEHLLLALLGAAGSRAAQRLEAAGGRYDEVSALIVRIVGRGDEEIPEQILPYTPNAAAVVRQIREEAQRSDPDAIGTEHILRAALLRRDSVAVRVLADCAVDTRKLADELKRARPDDP